MLERVGHRGAWQKAFVLFCRGSREADSSTTSQKAAEAILKPKAFAYYASAADDELTKNWNNESFSKIRLRPRVLRDVTDADLSTTILGTRSSLPLFIAPAAMGRLAHPEGERCLARTAASYGFPYCVCLSTLR